MIEQLITLLEGDGAIRLCELSSSHCVGIDNLDCPECPFANQDTLDATVRELKELVAGKDGGGE